jgi:hypothetical protein
MRLRGGAGGRQSISNRGVEVLPGAAGPDGPPPECPCSDQWRCRFELADGFLGQAAGVRDEGPATLTVPYAPGRGEAGAGSDDGRGAGGGAGAMAGLLQALAADGVEWVRAEGLYTLGGLPGYS